MPKERIEDLEAEFGVVVEEMFKEECKKRGVLSFGFHGFPTDTRAQKNALYFTLLAGLKSSDDAFEQNRPAQTYI